ncbi:MAG: hypothetical protein JXA22_03600 [Candidatus Thermoplasmatota archaeon]|nr:hypothetical protein [Candidatus Thermoplasmatota archaeon]
MTRSQLNRNEEAVLLSIMKNPEHGDRERATSIDMNLYTFNKIKNKLIRDRVFKKELIPNFGLLGFEILVTSFGSGMEPYLPEDIQNRLGCNVMEKAPTHLVFFISEPGMGLGFHAVEDFTSMKNGLVWAGKRVFNTLKMERSEMEMVPFSFRDLKVERMFDLSDIMISSSALDRKIPIIEAQTAPQRAAAMSWGQYFELGNGGNAVELDETEWSVLVQLVTNPDGSDQFHVNESGLSRYRFQRIRDSLFGSGVIKPLVILNPLSIGLDVLTFFHLRFKPSVDPLDLWGSKEWEIPPNLILTIMDRQDAVGIGLYPNLAEGSKANHGLLSNMGRLNILDGSPHIQVFSLRDIISRSGWQLTFARPLLQKGDWNIPPKLLDWLGTISY